MDRVTTTEKMDNNKKLDYFLMRLIYLYIQIITRADAVDVLRSKEPYAAFVFRNHILTEAISHYLASLIVDFGEDRRTVIETLKKWMRFGPEG